MTYSHEELIAKKYSDEELDRFEWVAHEVEPNHFTHPFKHVRHHPVGSYNFERWAIVKGEVVEYVEEEETGLVDPLALLGEALSVLGAGQGVRRGMRRYTNDRTGELGPWMFIPSPESAVGPSSSYEDPSEDPLIPIDQLEGAYLQREAEDEWERRSIDMHYRQVRYTDDADNPGVLTLVTAKMVNDATAGDDGDFPKFEDVMAEKKRTIQREADRREKAAAARLAVEDRKATAEPKAPIPKFEDSAQSRQARAGATITRGD